MQDMVTCCIVVETNKKIIMLNESQEKNCLEEKGPYWKQQEAVPPDCCCCHRVLVQAWDKSLKTFTTFHRWSLVVMADVFNSSNFISVYMLQFSCGKLNNISLLHTDTGKRNLIMSVRHLDKPLLISLSPPFPLQLVVFICSLWFIK